MVGCWPVVLLFLLYLCLADSSEGRTAWFVSWQHAGHLRALCPTARELRRRGWEVSIVAHDEARRYVPDDLHIVSAGPLPWSWEEELELRDVLWSVGPPEAEELSPEEAHSASVRRVEASEKYFLGSMRSLASGLRDALRRRSAERPGSAGPLIVADVASVGALDIAADFGLPFVVFSSWPVGPTLQAIGDDSAFAHSWLPSELFAFTQSAGSDGLYDRCLRAVMTTATPWVLRWAGFHAPRRQLRDALGLEPMPRLELMEPPRTATGGRALVLVANHWALDRPRPMPPHVRLVGPTENYTARAASKADLPPDLQQWLSAKDPVVYVSLGTSVRPGGGQIAPMVEGMRRLPDVAFLWDIREGMVSNLQALPPNVRTEESLDQLKVLASGKLAVFVSHCGLNSLHEAMHFGVPIVAMPFIGDQLVSARIVEEAGVGRRLSAQRLTADAFVEAVRGLLRDRSAAEAAVRVGRLANFAGGARAVADAIDMVATEGVDHLQMWRKDTSAGRLWDVYVVLSIPLFMIVVCLRRCFLRALEQQALKSKVA